MAEHPLHIVVMGVSGSGKTTVARSIAQRTGRALLEADELHPEDFFDILSGGELPDEAARQQWITNVRDWMDKHGTTGESTVVACTALTQAHRALLNEATGVVFYVHLYGTEDILAERMERRIGTAMPHALLDSQLALLERLASEERGIQLDVARSPEQLAEDAMAAAAFAEKAYR